MVSRAYQSLGTGKLHCLYLLNGMSLKIMRVVWVDYSQSFVPAFEARFYWFSIPDCRSIEILANIHACLVPI